MQFKYWQCIKSQGYRKDFHGHNAKFYNLTQNDLPMTATATFFMFMYLTYRKWYFNFLKTELKLNGVRAKTSPTESSLK